MEINLVSEGTNRPTSSSNNFVSQEHSEQPGDARYIQQVAPFKISDELTSYHGACGISTQAHGKETVSSASGEQNTELRQFAADFLSLYCR